MVWLCESQPSVSGLGLTKSTLNDQNSQTIKKPFEVGLESTQALQVKSESRPWAVEAEALHSKVSLRRPAERKAQ